jgi:hypothetical protein
MMHIITASGKSVKASLRGWPGPGRGLQGALAEFKKLPEADRKPVIEDRGPFKDGYGVYTASPPEGGLIIHVYHRPLNREASGRFVPLKDPQKLDFSEFGGPPKASKRLGWGDFSEPQRDDLWLTKEEWRSLIPASPNKGDTIQVPAAIRLRIFALYLFNDFSQFGGVWRPNNIQSGDLSVTVADVSPMAIHLTIGGSVVLHREHEKGKAGDFYRRQPKLPEKIVWSYEARLHGAITYDVQQKAITRFDLVALGDYRGPWGYGTSAGGLVKAEPVPLGFAFELDGRNLPSEQRNRTPYALFVCNKVNFFAGGRGDLDYWALDKAQGKE